QPGAAIARAVRCQPGPLGRRALGRQSGPVGVAREVRPILRTSGILADQPAEADGRFQGLRVPFIGLGADPPFEMDVQWSDPPPPLMGVIVPLHLWLATPSVSRMTILAAPLRPV